MVKKKKKKKKEETGSETITIAARFDKDQEELIKENEALTDLIFRMAAEKAQLRIQMAKLKQPSLETKTGWTWKERRKG